MGNCFNLNKNNNKNKDNPSLPLYIIEPYESYDTPSSLGTNMLRLYLDLSNDNIYMLNQNTNSR